MAVMVAFKGELNIEQEPQLLQYLRANGRLGDDEQAQFQVLHGGRSNRTVLMQRAAGPSWVFKQALISPRVSEDGQSDPLRTEREALGLRHLPQLTPRGTTPPLVFEDHQNHLLAMQAVPQPHEHWAQMLLEGRIESSHVVQFGTILGEIHRQSFKRCDELEKRFADRTFFESLRIEPYYRCCAEQVPDARPFFRSLIDQTRARRLTLVHGDYSPRNILVHEGQLVLLDHEVMHWGDPAFDVGFAIAHLLSKAHHLPPHRARLHEAALEFWQAYDALVQKQKWRPGVEAMAVGHALGCLMAGARGKRLMACLTEQQRDAQWRVALAMMRDLPQQVPEMCSRFIEGVANPPAAE